jgi:aspartate kinase
MKTVVLKFGGTSVGNIDRIKKVCKIISSYKKKKYKVGSYFLCNEWSSQMNLLINRG